MNQKPRQESEPFTLRSLEARLRNLPGFKVPRNLEARIIAAVPENCRAVTPPHTFGLRPARWGLGMAAAAVLLLAVLLAYNYGPGASPQALTADLNDSRTRQTLFDQNAPLAQDINRVDSNALK